MCKDGLKKYMLLKKEDGEEVSIYRVLELIVMYINVTSSKDLDSIVTLKGAG